MPLFAFLVYLLAPALVGQRNVLQHRSFLVERATALLADVRGYLLVDFVHVSLHRSRRLGRHLAQHALPLASWKDGVIDAFLDGEASVASRSS